MSTDRERSSSSTRGAISSEIGWIRGRSLGKASPSLTYLKVSRPLHRTGPIVSCIFRARMRVVGIRAPCERGQAYGKTTEYPEQQAQQHR